MRFEQGCPGFLVQYFLHFNSNFAFHVHFNAKATTCIKRKANKNWLQFCKRHWDRTLYSPDKFGHFSTRLSILLYIFRKMYDSFNKKKMFELVTVVVKCCKTRRKHCLFCFRLCSYKLMINMVEMMIKISFFDLSF
jgi:hypothetical protein